MSSPAGLKPQAEPRAGPAPLADVFRGSYLWTTITILAGTVIASMDTYIVNTSMPRVLADLGQPEFYAWVASAFVLAQVVGLAIGGAWKDRSGVRTPFMVCLTALACARSCAAWRHRCRRWCWHARSRAWPVAV